MTNRGQTGPRGLREPMRSPGFDKKKPHPGAMNVFEMDKKLFENQESKSRPSPDLKPEELRILLIGKTGDGKSATGNTILGRPEFKAALRACSVTVKCQFAKTERYGRNIVVVDTPGLCDTQFPPDVIKKELIRSVGYASPGFHVIIFVLAAGRYTKECEEVRDQYFEWFGADVSKYSLILISRGDEVEDREDYLKHIPPAMDEFLKTCKDRCIFFNNNASGEEAEGQILELINRIDTLITENKGSYFSNIAFRLAKKYEHVMQMPIYKWVQEKFHALGKKAEDPVQSKPNLQQDSDEADWATFEQGSDEINASDDQQSGSGVKSDEDLDSFLQEHIYPECDTNDFPMAKETSQIDKDDRPKLRDQLKETGFFDKFVGFFTSVNAKYALKLRKKRASGKKKR